MSRVSGRSAFPRAVAAAFLLGAAAPLLAQGTGEIRGRVTGAGGRPIDQVQVWIPGTNRIARTDPDGQYRLMGVPAGAQQLRAQQLGYTAVTKSVTVAGNETATVDFELREAALSLDAVVVTGTAAEARKKEIGNSMAMISAKQIAAEPVHNTQDIVSASAPGITVLQNSGQPGAGGTIRLRGVNSLTQGNSPIVYLDGIRIFSDAGPNVPSARQNTLSLNDIKPDDIDHIEVVKGAAATTLYGTEASGGVIQIFTKRGTATAPEWSLDATGGMNHMGHIGPSADPTGLFVNSCRGSGLHDAFGNQWVDPTCPANGSWLRNGGVQRYGLSVRGGAQQTTYFLSGTYSDEEGVVQDSRAQSGGVRGNFSFAPAKSMLFNFNSSYIRNNIDFIPDGNLANGFMLNVGRGNSGNFKGGKGECANITVTCTTNAYLFDQKPTSVTDHFIGGLTLNYSPTSALTNRFAIGYDYNVDDNATVIPFGFLNLPNGQISKQDWNHTKLSLDYAGSYQHQLLGLATTSSWGGQVFDDRDHFMGITGTNLTPGDPTLGSASTVGLPTVSRIRVVNAGFFLQEMAGWRDRLFVTGGLRVDGNSAFGQSFGLQPYPKLSVAYVISDESFWPRAILPTMKLRAAIGESGKAPGAFDAVRTWDPVAADEGKPAFTTARLGDPNLGPERTREMEMGFDVAALDDRLSLEATGYTAKTIDALVAVNGVPSNGWPTAQLENVGTLQNRGLELGLSGTPVRTNLLDWSGRINFTAMRGKAVDLGGRILNQGSSQYVMEGQPIPVFVGYVVTNPDAIADPKVQANTVIGSGSPTRLVSVGTTLRLRQNLTFDILGEYQGGAYVYNYVGYQNALRSVWYPCYDTQQKLKAAATDTANAATILAGVTALQRAKCAIDRTKANSDFWIAKGNFFKIRSASVAYTLPARFTPRVTSATLILAGRNLWKSTKYDGLDPELRDAADQGNTLSRREYYQLPPSKQFTLSVRASF